MIVRKLPLTFVRLCPIVFHNLFYHATCSLYRLILRILLFHRGLRNSARLQMAGGLLTADCKVKMLKGHLSMR